NRVRHPEVPTTEGPMANGAEPAFTRSERPAALGADEWDDFRLHGPPSLRVECYRRAAPLATSPSSTVRLAVGAPPRCPSAGRTRGAPASTARAPGLLTLDEVGMR